MTPSLLAARIGAVAFFLFAGSSHAAPYSFDAAPGRLPKDVVPIDYTIAITPDIKAHTIKGHESVVLDVRRPVTSLTFNSLNERLSHVTIDGTRVAKVVSNDETQLTVVSLAGSLAAGRHTLVFDYVGTIEKEAQGLFAQDYRAQDGKVGTLLSTQMEATDARRMFPCWDEPAFRATFTLSATVPAAFTVVGNMPVASREVHGDLATTTFERTPSMPSYLVEYSAGDLASIKGSGDGTPMTLYAVRGHEQEGRTALANAAVILDDYNRYFGFRFPLPKLDSIAVPGGFQGAMENWGAITYNDQTLLLNPSSTQAAREEVFSIEAHEIAHQWFGDLVTMAWWDEIWLNESFASWMAAKETAARNPDWHWWEREDASKERAMKADSLESSHPIAQHVTDELQATNAFDPDITYNKGQAVLRMFEAYLGPEVFRSGVASYMKARAYSNATATDLWNALGSTSNNDVASIAASWTTQPGFPLIAVAARCAADGSRTLELSQSRFLISGASAAASRWSVPLRVRSGSGEPQSVLFSTNGQTVSAGRCGEALSINAEAIGYYRVLYDTATLATNSAAFATLPAGDRIALLDDEWALVLAGRQPLKAYLALTSAMGPSLNVRAWEQIATSFERIEHALRGTPKHDAFLAYARGVLKQPFDRLGFDAKAGETSDVTELRRVLISDLGRWGDPAVSAEARRRFAAFMKDRSTIAPDDQSAILHVVAANADQPTFDALKQLAGGAQNQAELGRYYGALMQVRDPALAKQASVIAMTPSILPPEAEALRVRFIGMLGEENPALSWQTFSGNYDQLMATMGSFGIIWVAQHAPEGYASAVPLDELDHFVRSRLPAEMSGEADRGMEAARLRVAQDAKLAGDAAAELH